MHMALKASELISQKPAAACNIWSTNWCAEVKDHLQSIENPP